jgi:hypothetical protein
MPYLFKHWINKSPVSRNQRSNYYAIASYKIQKRSDCRFKQIVLRWTDLHFEWLTKRLLCASCSSIASCSSKIKCMLEFRRSFKDINYIVWRFQFQVIIDYDWSCKCLFKKWLVFKLHQTLRNSQFYSFKTWILN